jgi:predicted lipoprotein with Yx(FWY)xxD motif
MIRSSARLHAHGRKPRMRPAVPVAAVASMVVVAACGSYSGSGTGLYGSAPSGAPATHASAAPGAALTLRKTRLGTILTSSKGFTVYAFEADKGPKSACAGACAAAWPPVTAAGDPITVAGGAARSLVAETTRPDGVRQLTYAGHPLYTYVGDTSPGATNGQGSEAFGARWDVLTSAGREVTGG